MLDTLAFIVNYNLRFIMVEGFAVRLYKPILHLIFQKRFRSLADFYNCSELFNRVFRFRLTSFNAIVPDDYLFDGSMSYGYLIDYKH